MSITAAALPQRRLAELAALTATTTAVGAAAAVVYTVDPTKPSFLPQCWLYAATGLWCPGCGGTRAVHSLLHGDVAAAFSYNPLFMVALPFMLAFAARYAFGILVPSHRMSGNIAVPPRLVMSIAVGLVLFAVLRNIPVEPFTFLAPPDV